MAEHTRELLRAGAARHRAGDFGAARLLYAQVLGRAPRDPDALHLMGLVLHQEGDSRQGRALIARAIAQRPDAALFHANLGRLLRATSDTEGATESWGAALRLAPGLADAALPLARLLRDQGRSAEARARLTAAIEARPGQAVLLLERAACDQDLGRQDEAIDGYRTALEAGAVRAEALNGIATSLFLQDRGAEALARCEEALAEAPDHGPSLWMRAVLRGALCDWRAEPSPDRDLLGPALRTAIESGRLIPQPFALASLSDDSALLRRAAESWIAAHAPAAPELVAPADPAERAARRGKRRLKLGYLSSEMRAHAMGWLMAGLYEAQDRERFELVVYNHGRGDGSETEARIKAAVDDWVEIAALPHDRAARRIRDDGVDILIDLKGHTVGARPQILAARPAPLQLTWLGYPGTTGAPYVDYLLADRQVVPHGEERHYSEAVVRLPDCYQVTDPAREIAAEPAERAAVGLPSEGFVFCCFNALHKIAPPVFARWLALLRAVEGSHLWLLDGPAEARGNLRRGLAEAGLDPRRLVFAPRLDQARHLARHRLADLFLDTLPYGAHTTASDALWAGLPLVTCRGRSFAGRVAASLLEAFGLPELITTGLDDYQALALALARDPARLAALRRAIAERRGSAALFDCRRFTRHYEEALLTCWQRWLEGAPPTGFAVAPQAPCPGRRDASSLAP